MILTEIPCTLRRLSGSKSQNVYYMKRVLVCILSFVLVSGVSQNNYVDSVLMVLPTQHDTVKMQTLHRLSGYFQNSNADSALKYADMLYELASKKNSVRWQANALNQKGLIKVTFNEYASAIVFFKNAAKLYQTIHPGFHACR